MRKVVLLTGGTGFLGTLLAARLVRDPEITTYVLVRAADEEEAAQRLRSAWYHDRTLYAAIGGAVIPVCGDGSF